ncbi:hypothetical protein HPB47_021294 [Ixodes persulcatus]|uniref:Uncharacterized protein n=1 Tax=Ixodes persulcatus TaxID=34615 RepID=A0AC60QF78_IXOPE|nr:hypothetical protein HPB47_021294 [Ixodes persulcatus]
MLETWKVNEEAEARDAKRAKSTIEEAFCQLEQRETVNSTVSSRVEEEQNCVTMETTAREWDKAERETGVRQKGRRKWKETRTAGRRPPAPRRSPGPAELGPDTSYSNVPDPSPARSKPQRSAGGAPRTVDRPPAPHPANYDAPACPASELLAEHKRLSCRPRKTLVSLPPGPPEVIRFPKLVELERCHGSCYQESHLCHPVATQQIIVQVITVNLTEGRPLAQCTEVIMEKHSKCSCGCRIKKSHCSESQVYAASECTCKCKNLAEAKRCTNSNKVWNPSRCSCDCLRDETSCSTGFYFSKDDCRCQPAVEYNVEGS